jgi:hypothetical protein
MKEENSLNSDTINENNNKSDNENNSNNNENNSDNNNENNSDNNNENNSDNNDNINGETLDVQAVDLNSSSEIEHPTLTRQESMSHFVFFFVDFHSLTFFF